MINPTINLIIIFFGLAATAVLFYRFPRLPVKTVSTGHYPTVSIIIPARNEEKNLGLLLSDLTHQTIRPFEIICVDDASEDQTAAVARNYGVRLISVKEKPAGWTGKTWACQRGAETAGGEILLFLDADVRLSEKGFARILAAHQSGGRIISVQPYHYTERNYEQLSLVFNLVQIAANGTALPRSTPVGLYGPVILLSRTDYFFMGGHDSVKSSIIEDMSLGARLKALGLSFRDFVGDHDISFRMYGGGMKSLWEGWTKNLASGAGKTALPVFLLVFFWIASLLSVPFHIVSALAASDWVPIFIYGTFYVIWAATIRLLSIKIGQFKVWSALFYPIPLTAFLVIFTFSAIKKIFRLNVRWKGREIPVEDHTCD